MSLVQRSLSKADSFKPENSTADIIKSANYCLLYKDFERCLEICLRGIGTAKNFPEHYGSAKTIEALSIIATQAYAELNRWQEVLPFITQIYNGIEDCPAKIVQLCVLLHAHMKDFTACSAIAHIWLRNPTNSTNPQYNKLVEIFIVRVLQQQNRLNDVPAFLDSCPGLDAKHTDVYKRYAECKETELKKKTEIKDNEEKNIKAHSTEKSEDQSKETKGLLNTIHQMIGCIIPPTAWYLFKRIAMLSIFIYWICTRANIDLVSNERLMGIFSTMLQLWRSMFTPFYATK